MAAKFDVPLPKVPQDTTYNPVVVIPGEKIPVDSTPVDLATAAQDPEISLLGDPNVAGNVLNLSLGQALQQVNVGNSSAYPVSPNQSTNPMDDIWHYLRDTKVGNAVLLSVGIGLIVTLIVLIHKWTSDASTLNTQLLKNPTGLSSYEAAIARKTVDQHIADTGQIMSALGVAPEKVATLNEINTLSEGTLVAAYARRYQVSTAPAQFSAGRPIVVTGTSGPTHFTTLKNLNVNHYLDTISQNQTPNSMTENSSVIHEVSLQNR